MRIIGCDLHARQQTLAMLDTTTGEVVNLTLMHEGDKVREFYSELPRPALVGIEATGSMQWFLNLMEELGIECRVGHPAQIRAAEPRKQKHDRRGLDSEAAGRKPFSNDLAAVQGAARSARLVVTPSPVGAHARTHAERAAGHCLGEWFTARSRAVELRRTSEDRVLAVAATRRLSAERVAGDVQEHAIGDREPHSASSGASWKSLRSTVIDDPSRSGAGDGTGDRSIPGRSAAFH